MLPAPIPPPFLCQTELFLKKAQEVVHIQVVSNQKYQGSWKFTYPLSE